MGVLHEAVALLASALGTLPLGGASVTAEQPLHDVVSFHGEPHEWTFAYGANMGRAKLQRAGIHPEATLNGELDGHRLVFNGQLSDGKSEPAFADVLPTSASASDHGLSPVHGVLHSVTKPELEALDKTETGLYHRVLLPVRVQVKGKPKNISAWTYVDQQYQVAGAQQPPERAPSARYGRLVVCGAEQERLPGVYTRSLRRYLEKLGLHSQDLSCDGSLEPKLRGLRSFLPDVGGKRAQAAGV